jgi:glutathione S-transferase
VDGWLEITVLAERLGSGPSLFPEDPVDRALAVGFSAEICGQSGFGWSRGLMLIGQPRPPEMGGPTLAQRRYGALTDNHEEAPARVISVMQGLSRQLHSQRAKGSDYLIGDRLSACDLHWACFSLLIKRLSAEECPATAGLPDFSATMPRDVQAAIDPILVEHRTYIWQRHIGLPLEI